MFETLFRVQSLGEAGKSWNNVNFLLVANRKKGRKEGKDVVGVVVSNNISGG